MGVGRPNNNHCGECNHCKCTLNPHLSREDVRDLFSEIRVQEDRIVTLNWTGGLAIISILIVGAGIFLNNDKEIVATLVYLFGLGVFVALIAAWQLGSRKYGIAKRNIVLALEVLHAKAQCNKTVEHFYRHRETLQSF